MKGLNLEKKKKKIHKKTGFDKILIKNLVEIIVNNLGDYD